MDSMVQLFTTQFKDSIDLALQQQDSRVASTFMMDTFEGEKASPLDRLDSMTVNEVTSRYGLIEPSEQEYTRRWITPRFFEKPVFLDSFDQLKSVKDPKSKIVESIRAAFERKKDDLAIAAFFGDALTGKEGTTTTTWASEGSAQIVLQTVGASAATGLNVAKLRAARKILHKNNVDFSREPVYIAVNAEAYDDLFDEAMVVSRDYNEPLTLKEGKIEYFMGFQFIHTELLVTDGTYRRLPVWTKQAMQWGNWGAMNVDIYNDKTRTGHPWVVYAKAGINAARLDPKRVVEIKIAE